MKSRIVLSFLLCFALLVQGQTDISLQELADETNRFLETYDHLYPLSGEYYALKDYDISEKEILEIFEYDSVEELSGTQDSVYVIDLISYFQSKILFNLEEIINHRDFLNYDISDLLMGNAFNVVKSDDNRLFNFTLDEKTGGTYRSQISVMHYVQDKSELQKTDLHVERGGENSMFEVFNNDGYSLIKALDTEEGTKYLMSGYVRGCSYCFEEHISLIKLEEDAFVEEFGYSINYRDYETAGITYDEASKTIYVEYVTDDLTQECNCLESYFNAEDYEAPKPFVETKCECVFKFNGKSFDLVKACFEVIDQKLLKED